MTKKTRNILFVAVALLFLILSPVVVFYSQGYRFDFDNFEIVKTGAFYFRVMPHEAKISITSIKKDQLIIEKETSFFFGTLYLENLIPQRYNVVVSKDGYHSWEKNLDVYPKKVTEANNIILLPKDIGLTVVEENVLDLSSNGIVTLEDSSYSINGDGEESPKESVVDEDVLAYMIHNNEMIALTKDGFIKKGGGIMKMKPLEIVEGKEYKLYYLNGIVVRVDDDFYFLNKDLEYELVFNSPNDPILSPDGKKIAYFNNNEIKILFLNDLEQVFLTRVSEKIQDVYWLNPYYLIFDVSQEIQSIEIDNRDKVNIVDLAYLDHESIYFSQKNKKLYVLSNNQLMESERIVPDYF